MSQHKTATTTKPKAARRGITLVEIAIVLVIVGLLLGGVLKGQELINNAKVRNIANRQISLKAAWFAFIGKYQALPGDYVDAEQNIPGAGQALASTGDGIITENEAPIVMQNLTGGGFLRCPQCTAKVAEAPGPANSMQNSYGGVIAVFTNGYLGTDNFSVLRTYALRGTGSAPPRLMTHSGSRIPSNIAAEVDLKIDDGIANEGDVVFNWFFATAGPASTNAPTNACVTESAVKQATPASIRSPDSLWWRHASAPADANCQFSLHI